MGRSTVHYADNNTNNILKKLHNKLRPAGTPVQRVEYIIELLLLRIFETKIKRDSEFKKLRTLFTKDYKWKNPKTGQNETNENRLFSFLPTVTNEQILPELNNNFFPFYSCILQTARQVFEGNLPQKVQDQLVLIEEVFSNSNFTNNVNSGNLGVVISLCAEIDEERLLKTDLLGDAIESALSETGGTKDIGLHRTPDHIRQFMTALVEPTYEDFVFDPACGTGGFLFDAFEFVMRRTDSNRKWPGEKAHGELREWFDKYFKTNPLEFPSIRQAKQFYRSGVTGIEYLGMIRKMAAINFYIRGLNPANIDQGDSLNKYNPAIDANSKTIVIANPPFGAERDQDAYPDVWAEYAKESETTILFVKLMLEHLKINGRCAVIVSEGFHTWDQFSAKALRKMLLDETNLRAIISLPQGVFVSKNGQGPKTSILLFEKGGKTDWVWYYKVTNDGYTMGTNRKEQPGNQLVECLSLYHKFVKHRKQPPQSKHQFCIPAQWIKTLDPRAKEKIRIETRAEMEQKGEMERKKKKEELNKKLTAKKITEAEKQEELKQFENSLENRILNEIAKQIDKAHTYSFNLANYRSTLSESQLQEWKDALKGTNRNGVVSLEEIYKKIKASPPENIGSLFSRLNPENALEVDIAREYVNKLNDEIIANHVELLTLKTMLRSGAKYPIVKLKEYLILNDNKIKPKNNTGSVYKVLGVSNEKGIFINDSLEAEETNQSYFVVEKNQFCYNPYRINVGSIALNEYDYPNQIISGAYVVFGCKEDELHPKYLDALLKTKKFLEYVNEKANGGVRMNFTFDYMENWEIPLPSLDEQIAIVAKVERQKSIIDGVDKITKSVGEYFKLDMETLKYPIGNFAKAIGGYSFPSSEVSDTQEQDKVPLIKIGSVLNGKVMNDLGYVDKSYQMSKQSFVLKEGDIVFAMTRPIIKSGLKYAIIGKDFEGSLLNQRVGKWEFVNEELLPKYLAYFMQTESYIKQLEAFCADEANQPNVSGGEFESIMIPKPNIDIQKKIVDELEEQWTTLEGIKKLKQKAEEKIDEILAEVWGESASQLETQTTKPVLETAE